MPDDALAEHLLHPEEFLALSFQHPVHRNAGPARHDIGDVVLGHFLAQQRILGLARGLDELLFELRNLAVGQLARLREIARALRLLQFDPRLVELLFQPRLGMDLVALVLPAGGQFGTALFKIGELFAQGRKPVLRRGIAFLGQRLLFDLELDDAPVEPFDLFGLALHFHADATGGLVHQVDRLVGQETVRDVAFAELRRCHDRRIGDAHAVMQLVLFLDAAQDRDRVLDARLVHEDGLEAPLEGRVLLDIFLVFVERRRADAMQLAARKGRLEQVGGIHTAFARARTDQRMHFVDEQDDLPVRTLHLVEHGLQTLFEFAAIFRASDQRAHVERHQIAVLQAVGHIAIGDAQRQPFGNGGLAGAGLTDQDGIVLRPAGEDLHRAADFLVAPDDGIELAVARRLGQVARIFLHRLIGVFRARAIGRATAGNRLDRGLKRFGVDPGCLERLARCRVRDRQRLQQPLHRHEAVARLLGQLLCLVEHAHGIIIKTRGLLRPAARHCRNLAQRHVDIIERHAGIPARALDQLRRHAFFVLEQRLQQVLGGNPLVAHTDSDRLRGLEKALGAVGELFDIHRQTLTRLLMRDSVVF